MSLLSAEDVKKCLLGHGKVFKHVCDTPGCGKCLLDSDLFIVLKWKKRTDGLQSMLGPIPEKIRCMSCEHILHPPPEVVKVKGAGRGAKKVAPEVAAGIKIDENLRKFILRLLKKSPEGIPVASFISTLRRKKMVREMSKKDVSATIKGMKKLKMFRKKAGAFMLPKEKKSKVVKAKPAKKVKLKSAKK